MSLLRTIPLLLFAGMASAESAPTPKEDLATLGYISAARPGKFHEMPPSGNAFPATILARMRVALGGERPMPSAHAPAEPGKPSPPANGH
ncbi:hypothetical protein LCM08_21180 [Salipiger pacificus]|nr:hypothetical protein [Alloyangia pacifica]MCA0947446.1 hypothetical protein [Alloyangia pacifica]